VALTSRVIKPSPPSGTIILYGYHAVPDTYDLSLWGPKAPVIVSLHPAHSPDQTRDLEIAMDAVTRGVYPLEKVITHTYRLEDIGRGFEDARTYPAGYVKGIVTP
jgi:threonine dehydrogenase-like Zn-dependent dehydrogenase